MQDAFGHGTHVAGIIAAAADDTLPVVTERYQGVAPGAHLVNLRVLDGEGAGRVSDVIRAIDWAVANRRRYGIRVINLSLGHPVFESAADDPLCEAVERAVAAGMVVVAAAGNLGKTADGTPVIGGIESPGNSPYAITVGALNTKQTRRAVGRRGGDLQLARPDAVRLHAEARPGGARQPDRVAGGAGVARWRRTTAASTWPGAGTGPTSS